MPQLDRKELGLALLERLPASVLALVERADMPSLGYPADGAANVTAAAIEEVLENSGFADTLIESALWLLIGELDRSHTLSQDDASAEGSFWHGIMHRREGDYSNAKYWFRRVGSHPVFDSLAANIKVHSSHFNDPVGMASLAEARRVAEQLTDAVEACEVGRGTDAGNDLRKACWWEWQLLLNHSMKGF